MAGDIWGWSLVHIKKAENFTCSSLEVLTLKCIPNLCSLVNCIVSKSFTISQTIYNKQSIYKHIIETTLSLVTNKHFDQ